MSHILGLLNARGGEAVRREAGRPMGLELEESARRAYGDLKRLALSKMIATGQTWLFILTLINI